MRKLTLTISAVALALGGAGMAVASHHGGNQSADANGDGITTLAETKAKADERFAKMDANGDGQLDAADREAKRAARFSAADTDGNGELTLAEMTAAREARAGQLGGLNVAQTDRLNGLTVSIQTAVAA